MTDRPIAFDVRTASPHFPGIGRAAVGLARALADFERVPPLVLLHANRPDARLPLDRLAGLTCSSSPFDFRQHVEVRRLLRGSRAVLYHSPYYLMPFAPGVPAVVTCYDLIPLTIKGVFGPARRLAFRTAHALAFRASSAIVVPSMATADQVAAHFPAHAGKIRIVRLGREFDGAPRPGAAAVRQPIEAQVPEGRYVLYVGSNKPHKNLRTLTEAWARVVATRETRDAVRLVFAGRRDPRFGEGGPTAEALRRSGRLLSLGEVSDEMLAELYRRAVLFVLPSEAEGFGFPALEAMSHGAPVVCSRIDALREVCGDAAAYFEAKSVGQLAGLLDHLLDAGAERDRLREAGLRRAAAFSWTRAAEETMAVYQRVLGGQG